MNIDFEIIEGMNDNPHTYCGDKDEQYVCTCNKCGSIILPIESIMFDGTCSSCSDPQQYGV